MFRKQSNGMATRTIQHSLGSQQQWIKFVTRIQKHDKNDLTFDTLMTSEVLVHYAHGC